MAFAGYLVKLGGSGGTELPINYIKTESYSVENQTTENESRKAVTGLLHRQVAPHKAVQVSFKTKKINNTSLAAINGMISAAMSDELSRDIDIEYYDPWTDTYKTAHCYMPDVKFTFGDIEGGNTIVYPGVEYTFIEY